MMPKRAEELLDGGSLYWVISGRIACREKLRDIRPFTDKDGIARCRLVLEPKLVLVEPRPFRAFQGWRYLDPKDAPRDLDRIAPGAKQCRSRCGANCATWAALADAPNPRFAYSSPPRREWDVAGPVC